MQIYCREFLTRKIYNFLDNYGKVILWGLYSVSFGFQAYYIYYFYFTLKCGIFMLQRADIGLTFLVQTG